MPDEIEVPMEMQQQDDPKTDLANDLEAVGKDALTIVVVTAEWVTDDGEVTLAS